MKHLFGIVPACAIVILTAACSKTPQLAEAIPEIAFEEAAAGYRISDSFNNIRALQLDFSDACIIEEIRRIVEIDDDRLIVLNRNELLAFDKNTGAFICRIGHVGEGPEEYLNILDFYYDRKNKTVDIIDGYGGKLVRYDISGDFIGKEKIVFPIVWMTSLAHGDDGHMMINKKLTGGSIAPQSKYAYIIVNPDGASYSIDPFGPVGLGGSYTSDFATRPVVATGNRFTFFRFLNDTIFTMEDGSESPRYKLLMKKKIPDKEVVGQTGDYFDGINSLSKSGNYLSGFDCIYETSKFIVLEPRDYLAEGFFWIDKTADVGIHIINSSELALSTGMMLRGESIINIKGSNENSLICAVEGLGIDVAKDCLSENPALACFNEDVKAVFENADPEGNPVVIIYSH